MVTDGKPEDVAGRGKLLTLDTTDPKDRAMLNEAIRRRPKRWRGLTDAAKDEMVQGLVEATRVARDHLNDPDKALEAAKALGQIVGVSVRIEGQEQADDHHLDNLNKPAVGTTVNVGVAVGGASDAGIVQFYVEQGIQDKMPPALLERYRAGEFD